MERIANLISTEKKRELYSKFKKADSFIGQEQPSDNSAFLGLENIFGQKDTSGDYKKFMDTRAGQFLDNNKDLLGSILGGVFGTGTPSPAPGYYPPPAPPETKSIFQSAWFWIVLILVLIIITWLIFKKK